MTKRSSSAGNTPVYFAGAALAALVGGTLWFSRTAPAPSPSVVPPSAVAASPNASPVTSPTPPEQAASPAPTPRTETTVYTVVNDADGTRLEPKTLHAGGTNKVTDAASALNAMALLPDSPLPKGTVAGQAVVDKTGLARVDFNDAFQTNFEGGDRREGLVINAILQTMGQFGAKQVQITVGGKKIDSLGGTQSLSDPLPVPPDADAPGKPPLAQGTTP